MTATVTSKGQITIPVEMRKQLGLKPGDRLDFIYEKGAFVLKTRRRPFEELRGIAKSRRRKPLTLAEMDDAIGKAVIERYVRATRSGRAGR